MKSIKNILAVAVAVIIGFVASQSALAQVPTTPTGGGGSSVTDEKVADAFATLPVKYYRFSHDFTGVTNNISRSIHGEGVIKNVRGHWGIVQLNIDNVELPIDPRYPMYNLPPYLAGDVRNFNLNIWGMDENDTITRYGYFYKTSLAKSEEILVTIGLQNIRKVIPYTLPAGHTARNTGIVSADSQYQGYYDSNLGAFVVYFDPLNPPAYWLMIDLTNGGTPFGPHIPFVGTGGGGVNNQNDGFGLVLKNQGGGEMILNQTDTWYLASQGLTPDKTATRNGTNYYAYYNNAQVQTSSDYLETFVYGMRAGSVIEVHGYKTDGTPVLLGKVTSTTRWDTVVPNITGYTSYKIVVIGLPVDSINGFSIQCYDSTGPWSFSDDGGIKGKELPMLLTPPTAGQ